MTKDNVLVVSHSPYLTQQEDKDEVLDLAPQGPSISNIETKIFINHPEITPSPEVFVQMLDETVRKHYL